MIDIWYPSATKRPNNNHISPLSCPDVSHQIDFDKWTHEEDLSDEARDINDDFPGLYEKMQAEELGWPSKREFREGGGDEYIGYP